MDYIEVFLRYGYILFILLMVLFLTISWVLNIIWAGKQWLKFILYFILLYGWLWWLLQFLFYKDFDIELILAWFIWILVIVFLFWWLIKEIVKNVIKTLFKSSENDYYQVYDNVYLNEVYKLICNEKYDKALHHLNLNKRSIEFPPDITETELLLWAIYQGQWNKKKARAHLDNYQKSFWKLSKSEREGLYLDIVDKLSHMWIDYR